MTLKFFLPKGWKLFEPLYRVKGGPKCVFSGLFSLLYLGTSEVSIPSESEGKQSCQGGTIEVLGHVLSWKLIESLFFFFLSTK